MCHSYDKDIPGRGQACPDYEGVSRTPGGVVPAPPSSGSEWGSKGARGVDICLSASPIADHSAYSSAATPLTRTAELRRMSAVGGCHSLLLRLLPRRRNHCPECAGVDARVHLAWGDVAISEDNRVLRVLLKRSKTDQFMRGVEVLVGTTGNDLCPVDAVREYVAHRGTTLGPFFRVAEGVPLTKARFMELVRSALTQAGVPVEGYSGHSFRVGAATAASQAGIPDSVIQALGRWSSPTFLRYIQTPREQLSQFTHSIAQGPPRRGK